MGARILLKVELAPQPGDAAIHCSPGGSQAAMVVADYQIHTMHAVVFQGLQEDFPVAFVPARGCRDP